MGELITEKPGVTTSDELSLRDVYLVLRRWGRFIGIFVVASVVVVFTVSVLLPKVYVSKVTLSLSTTPRQLAVRV